MKSIYKDIFKAIHEGKWLSIEYKNQDEEITKYWIGIKDIDMKTKQLIVDGLHLSKYTLCRLSIFIDSILSSSVIDGSYYEINKRLIEDIKRNSLKYQAIFSNVTNLKILNYLIDCQRLDTIPYKCEYALIQRLDRDMIKDGSYRLSYEQFKEIVNSFQIKVASNRKEKTIKTLCMNVLSIYTKKGLYVLAYRRLNLDVSAKMLRPDEEITICWENTIDGNKQSIRQFLDADEYDLLNDFSKNQELIKDRITRNNPYINGVDDMPYVISMGRDNLIDLEHEYEAIINMYDDGEVTYPIRAFFGDFIKQPERRKEYPIVLLNKRVNIDQLLAIYKALKHPIAYIQGPPGTGKTNTIINTIMSAFFNERTVLLTSYNNHPIDSVFQSFQSIRYKDKVIPFPAIRLGNNEKMAESLEFIKNIYQSTKGLNIYDKTLEKNKGEKIERTRKLTALLKRHEMILDLKERKETIEKLLNSYNQLTFQIDLQGRQLKEINDKLKEIGEVTDSEAIKLLGDDEEEFLKYLFYTSAKYIKRIDEPKNEDLRKILEIEDKDIQISNFNRYLSKSENMKKFLRIFPIVMTTCISAHKLGEPEQYFNMVIIDEASQCNTAISLVPILRGESLMLVGDPQQLNPVIVLDPKNNAILRQKYSVSNEYDYINNSIYKTYLACDAISDEILLSYHYRCNKKIIDFNNKKYYNGKLNIMTKGTVVEKPLVFVDIENNKTYYKNTAPLEAEKIIEFVKYNKDKKIGIITPFVNQKEYINSLLKENGLANATCGTVHAFQGDEKDVILFSLAISDQTSQKTYDWLKNNKELINVATSRAKDQLIILSSSNNLERLHKSDSEDDVFELVEYVKSNGLSKVTGKTVQSRALGVKPYSTETEEAFMRCLSFALDNVLYNNRKCTIRKEVPISHVFRNNETYYDLFYSGRFDFVVYEKHVDKELPILAIELDGKEHFDDEIVKQRDIKKEEICRKNGLELIRIENSYARRYNYIKDILISYFSKVN